MAGEIFGLSVLALLVILIIYWLPVIWVLVSPRTEGVTKFAWFIIALVFSWVGLIAFLLLAPTGGNRASGPY
jgi:hypothetical protein